MTKTLRECSLVSNLITGKHDDLHHHFEDFAELVTEECLDTKSWQEKSAELLGLETTIELYMEAHSNATDFSKSIAEKIINFLRKIRAHFGEYHSSRMNARHHYFPETHPVISSENVISTPVSVDIAVVDTVEFIYGCHENFFPHLQLNEVRERVNDFLGQNVTKRQCYANYCNIKTRKGTKRSDSDESKTVASYMQTFANNLHDRITKEACADDNRSK